LLDTFFNVKEFQMENEYDSDIKPVLERTCPKCNETKPLALFRYKLTRAQMKSQGYAGNVLVTAEGKVCTACRPKRKPISELSNKELMNKAASKDIHPLIAKLRIEKNKREANELRKAGRTQRWHELWAAEWNSILGELRLHLRKISQNKSLANKLGRKAKPEFLGFYAKELKRELFRLTLLYKTTRCRPTYSRWEEYIPEETQRRIREAWEKMPLAERSAMRTAPTMVTYRYDPEAHAWRSPVRRGSLTARRQSVVANAGKPREQRVLPDPFKTNPVPTGAWWE
jgi:hypothetical protein